MRILAGEDGKRSLNSAVVGKSSTLYRKCAWFANKLQSDSYRLKDTARSSLQVDLNTHWTLIPSITPYFFEIFIGFLILDDETSQAMDKGASEHTH